MRAGLIALCLAGCATIPRPAPEPEFGLRLAPAALGRELALSQRITVMRGEVTGSFEAQLEVDASVVRIAAVAMGQTVASVSWDGTSLQQRLSDQVPPAITGARILSDVQLAWWPAPAIRAGLPPGFHFEEGSRSRAVLQNGAPFVSVTYEGTAPAWAHVHLTHQRYGYALDIQSVELSEASP